MTITARPYNAATDLASLVSLAQMNNRFAPASVYLHTGDVLWRLFQNTVFDPQRHVRLWQQDETVIAWAWFEEPDGFVWCIHPEFQSARIVEAEIITWASEQIDPSAPGSDGHLWTRVCATDTATLDALARFGFLEDARHARKMEYTLSGPPVTAACPPGVTVRAVGGPDEWLERVELHRIVWHPSRVTLDAYKRLRTVPGYRPDLDLVAVAPDGQLAAYCLCWLDPVTNVGLFEPVGTHPAYRGQGLGKAVVTEGLRRLQAHGATAAWVTGVESNVAAVNLYSRVGFSTATYEHFYKKPL
jgi:ribosomal protein S18 acetylase RimI-like enzyme